MRAKIIAVELTTLLGFLAVLAVVLWWEWSHLAAFIER